MKKVILIMLGVVISTFSVAKDLRIAVEGAYPPFSETTSSGEVVGFDIDIAKALCRDMGRNCKLITQDWDGMIPGLLARKYDAIIASMSITAERKKKIDFSKKYYSSPATFVGKKGMTTVNAELKGKTVGVQRGTIMDKFTTDNFEEFGILNVRRYNSQDEADLDLVAGRVDFGFMEIATAEEFLKSKSGGSFAMVGSLYSDEKWFGEGIGIGVRKADKKLRDAFTQAISSIRNNGTYKTINDTYFTYDIYGK